METMPFVGPTFVMEVPTDWFAISVPPHQATFLSPQATDGWRASFVVTLRALEPRDPQTPQRFVEEVLNAHSAVSEAQGLPFVVLGQGEVQFGDVRGYESTLELTLPQGGTRVYQRLAIAFYGDMLHALNASRPLEGEAALLEKVDAIFEAMFGSLRFQEARLEA